MKVAVHIDHNTAIIMDVPQAKQFMDLLQNVHLCKYKGYGPDAVYVPQPINDLQMKFIEDEQLQAEFPEEGDK